MYLIVKLKQSYEPVPEGTYPAICYVIADLGLQYSETYKKTKQNMVFIWEIVDDALRVDAGG